MAKLPAIAFSEDMRWPLATLWRPPGSTCKKLIQLGSDSWLYKGDLQLSRPVRLKTKLVVKGKCDLPDGCVLEADIHADGSLDIGANSVCRGNLISGQDIHLGPGCRFAGLIHADGSVRLGQGTRGFKDDGMVVAYAGEILRGGKGRGDQRKAGRRRPRDRGKRGSGGSGSRRSLLRSHPRKRTLY